MAKSYHIYFNDKLEEIIQTMPKGELGKVCKDAVLEWSGQIPKDFEIIKTKYEFNKNEVEKAKEKLQRVEKVYLELKTEEETKSKEEFDNFMKVAFEKFKINDVGKIETLFKGYKEYNKRNKNIFPFEYLNEKLERSIN